MYWMGADGGLDGYADSDWGNRVSRKSTTGLVARYNRTPVFDLWRPNMQRTVSGAECYSASEMAVEAIYLP